MVREIEKSVRKLRGKALRSSKKNSKATDSVKPVASPNSNYSKYVALTPSASSTLEVDFSAENSTCPDVHVQDLVCRFDSPVCQSPIPDSNFPAESNAPSASTPRFPPQNLTDLVTPQPYRTPLNRHKSTVRRTQSERFGVRSPSAKRPGYFRSFRMTDSDSSFRRSFKSQTDYNKSIFPIPQSLLILEKEDDTTLDVVSSSPVREIITSIENKNIKRSLSSTSVQRSSSMPTSGKVPPTASPTNRKSLRKTKSTPFIDVARPSLFRDNSSSLNTRNSKLSRVGHS